jgi:hypothetical protein
MDQSLRKTRTGSPTLQTFFTDRLIRQRQASPNTIAAYRDASRHSSTSPTSTRN